MNAVPSVVPLTMRYKGTRNYLQGADIYCALRTAISEHCGEGTYSGQVTFHRFAKNQCDLYLMPAGVRAEIPRERVCDGYVKRNGDEWTWWLMESERPVAERYPFDESEIRNASLIEGRSIRLLRQVGFSSFDLVVAMTKHLHNILFPLTNQRWIISKFEFERFLLPDESQGPSLTLVSNLHNRITKTDVQVRGEHIGYIYFSAVTK